MLCLVHACCLLSISGGSPLGCSARVACCARCCVQCTHAALRSGGGSSLGCSTCFTCCARWFARCTHANVCNGGGSTRFACCARCFARRTHAALCIGGGSSCGCSPGALASRVASNASLSARRPLNRRRQLMRLQCSHRLLPRCFAQRTHDALSIGDGSSCGCRACFACCARRLAQRTHAGLGIRDRGRCGCSARFACCTECFAQLTRAALRIGGGSPCGRSARIACYPLQGRWQSMRLQRLSCLLRSMRLAVHARRPSRAGL
jgi:hypothetical protein